VVVRIESFCIKACSASIAYPDCKHFLSTVYPQEARNSNLASPHQISRALLLIVVFFALLLSYRTARAPLRHTGKRGRTINTP
jgi:hypothetical protein